MLIDTYIVYYLGTISEIAFVAKQDSLFVILQLTLMCFLSLRNKDHGHYHWIIQSKDRQSEDGAVHYQVFQKL